MKNIGLSINNKIALTSAFGVLILTVIFQLGIAQWNKPDIRYEEGNYYHTGNSSIVSLRLKNYGHSDAENIRVTANFPVKINDIASGDPAIKTTILSGGIGEQFVVFSIDRIVPSQTNFIYFATERTGNFGSMTNQGFVSSITYSGGVGKTGLPLYLDTNFFLGASLVYSLGVFIFLAYSYRKVTEFQKQTAEIADDLSKISKEIALLEETTELIDQAITEAKNSGVKLPEVVEEAQKKVKVALYGSKSSKKNKNS